MAEETLIGFNKVLKNLHREVNKIHGRTMKGLIRAAIMVRRDMEKTSPKIPVDIGNLRASFFIITSEGGVQQGENPAFEGDNASELAANHQTVLTAALAEAQSYGYPVVIMGFSAEYAVWVHERVDADFQREGAGAKYFETHLASNMDEMLKMIHKEARIR